MHTPERSYVQRLALGSGVKVWDPSRGTEAENDAVERPQASPGGFSETGSDALNPTTAKRPPTEDRSDDEEEGSLEAAVAWPAEVQPPSPAARGSSDESGSAAAAAHGPFESPASSDAIEFRDEAELFGVP